MKKELVFDPRDSVMIDMDRIAPPGKELPPAFVDSSGVALFDDRSLDSVPFFDALCEAVFYNAIGRPRTLHELKKKYPHAVKAQISAAEENVKAGLKEDGALEMAVKKPVKRAATPRKNPAKPEEAFA